ncbi:MAG: hypothetical protein RLZZ501_1452 [Pseudomonadota bacterium]|jgi:hypothetical protein
MSYQYNPLYNPAAGDTPLPTDPREIEAVLRAASKCYEANPYFSARYPERGADFARSDGGYLATLVEQPLAYVIQQVTWLGTLLACRGVPRWLLETHLLVLHRELVAALPKRAARYRRLLLAAEMLQAERRACLPQALFDALAISFMRAAGPGLGGVGPLPVAAVCDECCGIDKAVPSLVSWLGDPGRFPARWCTALDACVAQARTVARQRNSTTAIDATAIGAA